jgi:hypothetical protein
MLPNAQSEPIHNATRGLQSDANGVDIEGNSFQMKIT